MLGRRTAFLTLPIGDDRVYCYCDAVSPRDPDSVDYGPAERLRQLFSEFAEPAATLLDALDAASDIHVSTIEEVALDSRAREHVVLIGDAAHATTPHIAYGAGMAIEDSVVLAEELSRSGSVATAFDAFVARRFGRCKLVVETSMQLSDWEVDPPEDRSQHQQLIGRALGALAQPL
jgi:2-polyprenyl-6-methoxyphenol hydroxylase-like FAD-dependent oxidoreductase